MDIFVFSKGKYRGRVKRKSQSEIPEKGRIERFI